MSSSNLEEKLLAIVEHKTLEEHTAVELIMNIVREAETKAREDIIETIIENGKSNYSTKYAQENKSGHQRHIEIQVIKTSVLDAELTSLLKDTKEKL